MRKSEPIASVGGQVITEDDQINGPLEKVKPQL
jgi:hypothetical protein